MKKVNVCSKIIMDEETCNTLKRFLHVVGHQVLPCDEPLDAFKGFVVWKEVNDGEESLQFGWRFAKPIKKIENVTQSSTPKLLKACMLQKGWISCDAPERLRIGFVNYDKSICRYFKLSSFKMSPQRLQDEYNSWRSKHKQITTEIVP